MNDLQNRQVSEEFDLSMKFIQTRALLEQYGMLEDKKFDLDGKHKSLGASIMHSWNCSTFANCYKFLRICRLSKEDFNTLLAVLEK